METALIIVNIVLTLALAAFVLLRRAAGGNTSADADVVLKAHESFLTELHRFGESIGVMERRLREELRLSETTTRDALTKLISLARDDQLTAATTLRTEVSKNLAVQLEATLLRLDATRASLDKQLTESRETTRVQLVEVRDTTQAQLTALREENQKKLDEMRNVVDEKLQATLTARLDGAFKIVSERLELVHKGLGEMQAMAADVGGLKRALTNVKTRGILGEVQLESILEQFLTLDQLARNVETAPGSNKRVEFAVRMPGPSGDAGIPLWLPIDAKFPKDDYERLLDAQDCADKDAVEKSQKALADAVRGFAKDIRSKYIDPPHTTDFAILFVPTEGLYAELLRRPGLADELNHVHRVVLAGPTTLSAILQSLQMGFRTLALEKRSSEVWNLLGAVKTEFGRFGDVLDKVRKQLASATNTLDDTGKRTRAIEKKLRGVQELPSEQAALLLPPLGGSEGEPELIDTETA